MIDWRIYYDDNSTYSNEDGEWVNAPVHGVVCVVVRDPTKTWGRWVYSGWSGYDRYGVHGNCDYFVKYPDSREPFSTPDPAPFLAKPGTDESMIKYGRMCDRKIFLAIMERARHDSDFPIGTPRRRASDWQ